MFTDTHCHLYKEYYDDITAILNDSEKKQVNRWINNGCNSNTNEEVLSLIKEYPNMYGAIGIHPEYVWEYNEEDITFIKNNLSNEKIIAVGEIGLDYHYDNTDKEKQKELFELQLELAEKYNMPVIIHSRDATKDTIDILKKYKVKGVIHSFSGSLETANIYIKMGFLLGINGVITFKNANLKDVIKEVSLDNIVLETDSPYLTPEPYRGHKNSPSMIMEIAKYISNLKGIELEELARTTNRNIKELYSI